MRRFPALLVLCAVIFSFQGSWLMASAQETSDFPEPLVVSSTVVMVDTPEQSVETLAMAPIAYDPSVALPEKPDFKERVSWETVWIEEDPKPESAENGRKGFWKTLKGQAADDMVHMGLWSQHISPSRDYNEDNQLVGLQYKGYFAGTFLNSYEKRTVMAGIARTVATKKLFKKRVTVDLGYRLGMMYGYDSETSIPNIAGFTVLPAMVLGLSYKGFGIDISHPVGSNAVTLNFRMKLRSYLKNLGGK